MTPTHPENQLNAGENSFYEASAPEVFQSENRRKEKKKKPSKGVETLFRTTLANHIKLSEMADRKANLMISINTIVISVTLSAYTRKFDVPTNLLFPTILLLIVCLVTIVVSLIATNPTISPMGKRRSEVHEHPVDLLFFGSYGHLSAVEYRQQLRELINHEDDIYTSLIDNIYAQGQVLTRKYRLLKFAHQFFMIGFSSVVLIAVLILLLMN